MELNLQILNCPEKHLKRYGELHLIMHLRDKTMDESGNYMVLFTEDTIVLNWANNECYHKSCSEIQLKYSKEG